jgi:hypothetical protein
MINDKSKKIRVAFSGTYDFFVGIILWAGVEKIFKTREAFIILLSR